MRNILITGARAPAALELARLLTDSGKMVVMADCMRFPLSRASRAVRHYARVPSPVSDLTGFKNALIRLITDYEIDLLIPTCEEIFYIAFLKDELSRYCRIFCSNHALLKMLHHKYNVLEAAEGCGINIPESYLLSVKSHRSAFVSTSSNYVFKPAYSRFATHILLCPTPAELATIYPTQTAPWVAQKYIAGREYCSYSIATQGKIKAHACYHPVYRTGIGAGIYFQPITNNRILDFVSRFVAKHHFTGQIGFDMIETPEGQLFLIECNPRATSGIHLFSGKNDFGHVFSDASPLITSPSSGAPSMILSAMLLLGLTEFSANFIRHIRQANDVIFRCQDPYPALYQWLALIELIIKAKREGHSLKKAMTSDIEWNGNE